jgi:hypothetical protein
MEGDSPDNDGFEQARRESRRAQFALNFLVILSAVAGAAFFGYVLYVIRPFGTRTPDPVDIPTSRTGDTIASVEGEQSGLHVSVHDLDEAPEYSAKLSERVRADMGISQEGRLYRLTVRNELDAAFNVDLRTLTLEAVDGRKWEAQWVDQAASPENATAIGRMRVAQAERKFTLPPKGERQLDIFVPGSPPGLATLSGGRLDAGAAIVELKHRDVRAAQ